MSVAVFLAAAGAILLVGPPMARVADRLSEATGLGGALFGIVFLALATDLPEVALTSAASLTGTPRIAMGGVLGGTAAQLLYIAVVDLALRDRRLHPNLPLESTLSQGAFMAGLLTVPLLFAAGDLRIGWVSAGTIVLLGTYLTGLSVLRRVAPGMETSESSDEEDDAVTESTGPLWRRFIGFAAVLAGAGVALENTTESLGGHLGIGETAAGALLAGVVGSLPELVTAVSAARAGALELAVGNLVGSSAIDVTMLALADVLHTGGSVFELLGPAEYTLIAVGMAMTVLLLFALARRTVERRSSVAPESYLMLVTYVFGAVLLLTA